MALRFECDRCKVIVGGEEANTMKWVDSSTSLVVDGHLCNPCYIGLEQIITHYMTHPGSITSPVADVDVPDTIPEEWKQ